jgi:hypothetical protein
MKNTMAVSDIKSKLNELNDRRKSLFDELILKFQDDLKSLKDEYKNKIKRIQIIINNHEFNDGDDTYFRFYYEDMTIVFIDENEDGVRLLSSDEEELSQNLKDIENKLIKFFEIYDIEDFYERMYGNKNYKIEIEFN